jgi:hypothetical protein
LLTQQPYAFQNYNWGATVDGATDLTGTTDVQYHKFSCSKCHNPHASRLPRLMITNCLDTSHNTWVETALTLLNSDQIQISGAVADGGKRDCSTDVNSTHTVDYLDLSAGEIILSTSFTTGCSNQTVVVIWPGGTASLAAVSFNAPNQIVLSSNDFQKFIGRQIHSTGTVNLDGDIIIETYNDGVKLAQATSAQNCHRYVDDNADGDGIDAGDQRGWNSITPWLEP